MSNSLLIYGEDSKEDEQKEWKDKKLNLKSLSVKFNFIPFK